MNEWKRARKAAAKRRRRMIMNNDGDDAIRAKQATPQAFWDERSSGLEGSHVDSIFYSTGYNFHQHNYDSRVREVMDAMMMPSIMDDPFRKINPDIARIFIEQGKDCLQLIIDFCRKNRMEVFWSLRMNDIHDNWYPLSISSLKRDHPELLLFRQKDIGKSVQGLVEPHMYATAVDYGKHEIGDIQYKIICDVCQRYDVDGIELDFMRNPIFFRPTMEGLPVTQKHIDIMTDFLVRVRMMTERLGKERGRPILIACCVPNLPELARNIGLDIEEWLKKDLTDILVASLEQTPFTGSLCQMVKMKDKYDVPVYARLSGAAEKAICSLGEGIDRWAGAMTNVLRAGVDGIQTFNMFDPRWEGWHKLGDPAVVAGMDKTFAIDNKNYRTWDHVIEREGRLPVELAEGKHLILNLPVGDNIAGYAKTGKTPYLNMLIKLDRMTFDDKIEFRLNGRILNTEIYAVTEGISPVACGTFFLRAMPDPRLIKQGDNKIEVFLKKRCESANGMPVLTDISLSVIYDRS